MLRLHGDWGRLNSPYFWELTGEDLKEALWSERPVTGMSMCSSYRQKNSIQRHRKIGAVIPGMMAQAFTVMKAGAHALLLKHVSWACY